MRDIASTRREFTPEEEPWFRFIDSRRAVVGLGADGQERYAAKLVDLPCILETHKTLDAGKHMFKVADISQMLIVEDARPLPPDFDEKLAAQKSLDPDDYIWPHGVSPPFKHVRKRRFRRRIDRRATERIERAVEELLLEDQKASRVHYGALLDVARSDGPEIIDAVDYVSDEDEKPNRAAGSEAATPSAVTPGGQTPAGAQGADDDPEDSDGSVDDELLAAIEGRAQADGGTTTGGSKAGSGSEDEDGDDDLFGSEGEDETADNLAGVTRARSASGSEDEAEDESPDVKEARQRVAEATAKLKAATRSLDDKAREGARTTNALMRSRYEQVMTSLRAAVDQAQAHLDEAKRRLELVLGAHAGDEEDEAPAAAPAPAPTSTAPAVAMPAGADDSMAVDD